MSELTEIKALTSTTAKPSYLFYGGPGVGKTWLSALHPGKRKLWLDMDQKLDEMGNIPNRETIEIWSPREALGAGEIIIPWSPDPKHVEKGRLRDRSPQGFNKLVSLINELLGLAAQGKLPYDLVVLDSLSAASEHWRSLTMYEHRVTFMTERLWGVYLAGMTELISGFLRLPCERIVIAHEKRFLDENVKVDVIRPAVDGQLGNNLVKSFTEAYYIAGRGSDGKYRMRTVSDYVETSIGPRLTARTSNGLQPEEITGPDIFRRRNA